MDAIKISACTERDLPLLRHIASQTYYETFYKLNSAANMAAYLEEAFDIERLRGEMANAHSCFYFLYCGVDLSGYLKLNDGLAQTDLKDSGALEIERIYVQRRFQGRGLGQLLLERSLETARKFDKEYLWLGVWEKNSRARAFYERNGFYAAGTHSFAMGEEVQNDIIMRRDLRDP